MGDTGPDRVKRHTTPPRSVDNANSTDLLEAWTDEILEEINRRLREETAFFSPDAGSPADAERAEPRDRPVMQWPVAASPEPRRGAPASPSDEGDEPAQEPRRQRDERQGLMSGDLADDVREAFSSLAAQVLSAPEGGRPPPDPDECASEPASVSPSDPPRTKAASPVAAEDGAALPAPDKAGREAATSDDRIFDALAGKAQAPDPNKLERGDLAAGAGPDEASEPASESQTDPGADDLKAPESPAIPLPPPDMPETPESAPTASGDARESVAEYPQAVRLAVEQEQTGAEGPVPLQSKRPVPPTVQAADAHSQAEERRRIAAKVGLQAYGLSTTRTNDAKAPWLGRAAIIAVPLFVFLAGGYIGWSAYWPEGPDLAETAEGDKASSAPSAKVAQTSQSREAGPSRGRIAPAPAAGGMAAAPPATFPDAEPASAKPERLPAAAEGARVADATASAGVVGASPPDAGARAVDPPSPEDGAAALAEAAGIPDEAVVVASRTPAAEPGPTEPTRPSSESQETEGVPSLHPVNAAGTAGNPIPLSFAELPDRMKSGLSFMIAGVPPGVSLSAGNHKGNGAWLLQPEDLEGLTLTPPAGYSGAFVLTVAMMKGQGPAKTATSEILEVSVKGPSPEIAKLIARGDGLLKLGDIASARLMFERAAGFGSAAAATAVGKTHDPVFHLEHGVRGPQANSEAAAAWYQKGLAGGDREAEIRLAKLKKWLRLRQGLPAQ